MAILAILLTVLGFLVFPSNIYAEFTFTIPQTTITDEQEIDASVTLSLQGQGNKTYYLEGALKKEGSTNYFGLTWNDSSWVKYTASNYTTLKSITTDSTGKWNGIVKTKIDKSSSLFTGDGNYTLRMKRFTSGGSNYWADNDIALTVTLPSSPTPTPSSPPTSAPSSLSSTSSFTISNTPSQINSDQSFTVSVNLSLPDNPNTTFYLKGAFRHPDKPSNYFGFTKVGSSWVKNSVTATSQLQITTDTSGNWTGNIEVQPDSEDSGFTGTGDYIFKVGRYTSGGSGPTWSNESNIKIVSTVGSDQGGTSTSTANTTFSTTNPSIPPLSIKNKIIASPQPKSYKGLVYQTATVAAATASTSPSPNVQVKSQKQLINIIPWIGGALIICGIGSLIFIYLRNRKIA